MSQKQQSCDWEKIIDDLAWMLGDPTPDDSRIRVPVSMRHLSGYLDVPRKTVIAWREGAQPRHHDGEMLIVHWCKLSGKGRESAPLTSLVLSAHRAK